MNESLNRAQEPDHPEAAAAVAALRALAELSGRMSVEIDIIAAHRQVCDLFPSSPGETPKPRP